MKRHKKIKLQYKKERVIFSDVLPYELPIIFSNRYFYRFLVANKINVKDIECKKSKVIWDDNTPQGARYIMALLLRCNPEDLLNKNEYESKKIRTIPFVFSIQHKPTQTRQLSVIHPANQIKMVSFYHKYKDTIIYLCSQSNFSMRKPQKVASYFFYKDRLHHTLLGRKTDKMEMYFNEYENLKTFFSYKDYTNIYKFYEDYRYQRAEKKFQYLLRMDVQSCFDSIYTHSIAWAINGGSNIYKDNFNGGHDLSIGSVWDNLMQEMNYNETNGIVIGPEFSRLFAEVILQQIDQRVEQELLKCGYKHKVDYECYRYVDDYFFFFSDECVKSKAEQLFQDYLKEYKLTISQEKTEVFNRPFITNITKAKTEIDKLIYEYIRLYKPPQDESNEEEKEDETTELDNLDINDQEDLIIKIDKQKAKECINSKEHFKLKATIFNLKFKAILTNNGVTSKDVLNYTIAHLSLKLESSLKSFDKIYKPLCLTTEDNTLKSYHEEAQNKRRLLEKALAKYLYEVLDVVFFMYSNNKRINTTLKVLQVLNTIIIYLDNDYIIQRGKRKKKVKRFTDYSREIVFKKIHDEISLVFNTAPIDDRIQLETLYFLIILRSINRKYRLNAGDLIKYLNIKQKNGKLIFSNLNALAIIILLYYIGNEKEYTNIKHALMKYIQVKYDKIPDNRRKIMSEFVILTLDLATCPYIWSTLKIRCMEKMGLKKEEAKEVFKYLKKQKYMFTKWTGVNITKELNAKISQEVYS